SKFIIAKKNTQFFSILWQGEISGSYAATANISPAHMCNWQRDFVDDFTEYRVNQLNYKT
ncbi:hypothetical protein ACJX0J_036565, partial [Zea mays]